MAMGRRSCADLREERLVLLGTVHRHPTLRADLKWWLETLKPDLLTLELSPYALCWREREGPRLASRLERILTALRMEGVEASALQRTAEEISALLEVPAEYEAAMGYARQHGSEVALIDLSFFSARLFQTIDRELITEKNLGILSGLPRPGEGSEKYSLARSLLQAKPSEVEAYLNRARGGDGIGLRDRRMAHRVRRHIREKGNIRHLVHIGGWIHLLDDPRGETLFSRLRDLRPAKILAADRCSERSQA